MSKFIHEVTRALNHPDILAMLVHFPMTPEERTEELRRFVVLIHHVKGRCVCIETDWRLCVVSRNAHLNLPRVLGIIDGTLVNIVPPKRGIDRRAYWSRKGTPSLNVQIVSRMGSYLNTEF